MPERAELSAAIYPWHLPLTVRTSADLSYSYCMIHPIGRPRHSTIGHLKDYVRAKSLLIGVAKVSRRSSDHENKICLASRLARTRQRERRAKQPRRILRAGGIGELIQ